MCLFSVLRKEEAEPDRDLGHGPGQVLKEVVKEVSKGKEVAEGDKDQIEEGQGHKEGEVKEVVEKVKQVKKESRADNKDEVLDQEIGRQDLGHGEVVKGQGHKEVEQCSRGKIRGHRGHLEVKEQDAALQGQDNKDQGHSLKEVKINQGQ